MSMYKYVKEIWKKPKENLGEIWKERLMQWRTEAATIKIERPTRIDRARNLGYKAKQGIVVVRQRVRRGGKMRPDIKGGRRPKHARLHKVSKISYQVIAEQRANDKFPNCEVLNSYFVAKDGKNYWYEIILVDRDSPVVKADPNLKWIAERHQRGRSYRGLTSASRKSRGLRRKGFGAEKIRPSLNANEGRGN